MIINPLNWLSPKAALVACLVAFFAHSAQATDSSCSVPFQESLSSPAVDLVGNQGPIDPDRIIDLVKKGGDSSLFEPEPSDVYAASPQALGVTSPINFPSGTIPKVNYDSELAGTSGLVRARVLNVDDPNVAYLLEFSLDSHATLARSALFRKLGYAIPAPKFYPTLNVTFKTLADRDSFLDHLADNTLTSRGRWVVGGIDEVNKNQLELTFQDIVLESAIITVPQFHWGILSNAAIQSRRSIRALLVPLTLLDIPESVNMYSLEPVKIYSDSVVFTRANAEQFSNDISIGDVRWISQKIALLTRADWASIIHEGQYPADIEALIIEKTLARTKQLMKVLKIRNFVKFSPDDNPKISIGKVIKGKATQANYPGFAARFAYGDPESPLSAGALVRFFGIQAVTTGLQSATAEANKYLQALSPGTWANQYENKLAHEAFDAYQKNPNQPFVAPIGVFGGPIVNGSVNASRNIVTGTYYGSNSQVQLVDTISAGVGVGGFIGLSGISVGSLSNTTQIQYQRSYTHVRPVADMKTAWKDSWLHLVVPAFMSKLSKALTETDDHTAGKAMQEFLDDLKTGEMFIINDTISASNMTNFTVPVGALLGGAGVLLNINEAMNLGGQVAFLSRTTIYRDADGLHVYLSRMKSGQFEVELDSQFYANILSLAYQKYNGTAHTKAFIFPEKLDAPEQQHAFVRAMRALIRKTNPNILEEEFSPFVIDHKVFGNKFKIAFGPWSFSRRENYHELKVKPPEDTENRYDAADQTRLAVEGQITKVKGSDPYGFAESFLQGLSQGTAALGQGALGDDPSSNFLGQSNTMSIGSELEITKGRPNHFMANLSRTFRGWTMKKARLLKLIAKIQNQLGVYAQGNFLVNPDEFTQTKKIQAYSVLWNMIIYEKGMTKLFDILDFQKTSTRDAQNFMVKVMGIDEYKKWCTDHDQTPAFLVGPYASDAANGTGVVTEYRDGQSTVMGCTTDWMKTVFDFRSRFDQHREVFSDDIHDQDAAIRKIRLVNRFLSALEENMDLELLVRWVGTDQAFFQAKVSGFRTKDENGDSEYFSNSIGKIDQDTLTGPLSDIQDASKIQMNELQARYLSGGF